MPKSLPSLDFSLQFALGDLSAAQRARHRAALPRHAVIRWLRHALAREGRFTIRLVGQMEGQTLNREYRHKDYATNVLTFDYAQMPVVEADLVLCADIVAREAREQGKTLRAHYAHLVVHGALHAQGWDHETSRTRARAMERLEIQILAGLGFASPY
jgi:probable rRNA maturation factor